MKLSDYRSIISQASKMKVLQVALGGGNPNQHPDFCEILKITRQEFNIVPSYTTNGRGLSDDVLIATQSFCGAVAISFHEANSEALFSLNQLINLNIKTNIHFLLTSQTIDTAFSWLENPPSFLEKVNAIVFLNYKPVGKDPNQVLLAKKGVKLLDFFSLAEKKHPFKIGFDSCSISGIVQFMNIYPIFIDRCEASRFSMYISEDMKMYPCSFMIDDFDGVQVTDSNIQNVWRYHEVFTGFRKKLETIKCQIDSACDYCGGGCPIFPQINFCSQDFICQ